MVWFEFIACSALVILTAAQLSRYADVLAEKTGLGRAWIGGILLAGVTSLPELVSGVTAVTVLNAPNLAAGGILGSCLFNLVLIALMDLAYQPGPILARAQPGHILSAGLGIVLLGTVVVASVAGPAVNGVGLRGFGLVSVAVVLTYAFGAQLIGRFERRRAAEVLHQEAIVRHYELISMRRAVVIFTALSVVVVVLGIWLAGISDRLAATTGMSRSFVGNLFLATATSLPEVAASLAAVRLGAIDLAISNVLGSNLFNVVLLPVYDLVDGGGNFWLALGAANTFAAAMAMILTGIVVVSLVYRASGRMMLRMSWDGLLLSGLYVLAMVVLYRLP